MVNGHQEALFKGAGVSYSLLFPPQRMEGKEVRAEKQRETKVTGGSETEEAKEGPCREMSKNWAWNLPEISS